MAKETMVQNRKASSVTTTFHIETTVSVEIIAYPSIVSALIINASECPRWDSTVIPIQGNTAIRKKIKFKSIPDAKGTFKLKVAEFEVEKKLVWGDGQRKLVYAVTNKANGTKAFSMIDILVGLCFLCMLK